MLGPIAARLVTRVLVVVAIAAAVDGCEREGAREVAPGRNVFVSLTASVGQAPDKATCAFEAAVTDTGEPVSVSADKQTLDLTGLSVRIHGRKTNITFQLNEAGTGSPIYFTSTGSPVVFAKNSSGKNEFTPPTVPGQARKAINIAFVYQNSERHAGDQLVPIGITFAIDGDPNIHTCDPGIKNTAT